MGKEKIPKDANTYIVMIFNILCKDFPTPQMVNPSEIGDDRAYCIDVLDWLETEGYIRYKMEYANGTKVASISSLGLEALNSKPKALKGKSIWDAITKVKDIKELIKTASELAPLVYIAFNSLRQLK